MGHKINIDYNITIFVWKITYLYGFKCPFCKFPAFAILFYAKMKVTNNIHDITTLQNYFIK